MGHLKLIHRNAVLWVLSMLFMVTSFLQEVYATKEDSGSDLIFDGQTFVGDLPAQIIISFFLGITVFDYTVHTIMMLYVFTTVLNSSRTCSEIFFTIIGATLFVIIRLTIIPVLFRMVPFEWIPTLPFGLVQACLYFNIGMVTIFSGVSLLTCIGFIIRVGVTGKKMKGSIIDPESGLHPMVAILMPIYNEEPDALFRAVESAIRCDYPSERKHVFLAFDDESESALYFSLLKKLKVLSKEVSEEIKYKIEKQESKIENKSKMIFPPRLEWVIEGVRLTVCRFPHEGKSPTQGKSFKIINEIYGTDPKTAANTLVLFIDSDIILHENALHNFVVTAVKNPKLKGSTGLITCRTSRKCNIYQYLQDSEYVDGQMFARTSECIMGGVSCLPGALTLIRLNALQKVAPKYFIEFDKKKNIDFHRYHLGEDRYMTSILVELSDGPFQVSFISSAQCKTDAPDSFQKLLKQRRRWVLGGLTNDVCMISSPLMWRKIPLMVFFKLYAYSMKGMDWLFGVMIVVLVKNDSVSGLAIFLIFGLLICRFLLSTLMAFFMKRHKICVSNLLLFLIVPIFNLFVLLYSMWTWNVRSWGGPRTDTDGEKEFSKVDLIEGVMKQKEEPTGRTRRSLDQIESVSRIIDKKQTKGDRFNDLPAVEETLVKKFVPFPYETEFLGGGDFNENLLKPMPPGSPLLTPRRQQQQPSPGLLHESSSIPNLSILSINEQYLFGKLDATTREKAASFQLDVDYLAKVEDLATSNNSSQRGSSFNLRLSVRSFPVYISREPCMYDSYMSSNPLFISSDNLSGTQIPQGISIQITEH